MRKVAASRPGSRTSVAPASYGTYSHLCGSVAIESARSMPENRGFSSGTIAASAPYAPSAWNHSDSRAQKSAIASSGSTAPVLTVPALPTTIAGRNPAARSAATAFSSSSMRIRKRPSVGIFRSWFVPMPSRSTALSTHECTWSEA